MEYGGLEIVRLTQDHPEDAPPSRVCKRKAS